jgi:hypothetical protein
MLKSWMVIGAVTFAIALVAGILRPKDTQYLFALGASWNLYNLGYESVESWNRLIGG